MDGFGIMTVNFEIVYSFSFISKSQRVLRFAKMMVFTLLFTQQLFSIKTNSYQADAESQSAGWIDDIREHFNESSTKIPHQMAETTYSFAAMTASVILKTSLIIQ